MLISINITPTLISNCIPITHFVSPLTFFQRVPLKCLTKIPVIIRYLLLSSTLQLFAQVKLKLSSSRSSQSPMEFILKIMVVLAFYLNSASSILIIFSLWNFILSDRVFRLILDSNISLY